MKLLPDFIRAWFAWECPRPAQGCWIYLENTVTGRRQAVVVDGAGYQPLDWEWLLAGRGMPLIDGIAAWRSRYRDTLPDGMRWD